MRNWKIYRNRWILLQKLDQLLGTAVRLRLVKWWRMLFEDIQGEYSKEVDCRKCSRRMMKMWRLWVRLACHTRDLQSLYNMGSARFDIYKVLLSLCQNTIAYFVVAYWKCFCLTKTCLYIALSAMFKLCVYACIIIDLNFILNHGHAPNRKKAGKGGI
jgi:hypothetical protein